MHHQHPHVQRHHVQHHKPHKRFCTEYSICIGVVLFVVALHVWVLVVWKLERMHGVGCAKQHLAPALAPTEPSRGAGLTQL
jgi:hypothetical protein